MQLQRYKLMVIVKRERSRIDFIYEKLMEKKFTNAQLIVQILINIIIYDKKDINL